MAFEHSLRLRVVGRHRDGVTVACRLRPELLNGQGMVHGGVIASIADEAVWFAMRHRFGKAPSATTAELKVNYLRPIAGKRVLARAKLVRAGRTLSVGRVDLYDDGRRLAAVAVVTYIMAIPTAR